MKKFLGFILKAFLVMGFVYIPIISVFSQAKESDMMSLDDSIPPKGVSIPLDKSKFYTGKDKEGYFIEPIHSKFTLYPNNDFITGDYNVGVSSKESNQFYYDGKMWLTGMVVTNEQANFGIGLEEGRKLKQGYINYTRNGKSVSGGRKYTAIANNEYEKVVVYASAKDTLWPVADKTKFHYNWFYWD